MISCKMLNLFVLIVIFSVATLDAAARKHESMWSKNYDGFETLDGGCCSGGWTEICGGCYKVSFFWILFETFQFYNEKVDPDFANKTCQYNNSNLYSYQANYGFVCQQDCCNCSVNLITLGGSVPPTYVQVGCTELVVTCTAVSGGDVFMLVSVYIFSSIISFSSTTLLVVRPCLLVAISVLLLIVMELLGSIARIIHQVAWL